MNGIQANSKYFLIFENVFALNKMLAANTIFPSQKLLVRGCDLQSDMSPSSQVSSTTKVDLCINTLLTSALTGQNKQYFSNSTSDDQ